jgi:drug/metabolite transporter (DMT)-like permease
MSALVLRAGRNRGLMIILAFAAVYIIWGTTYLAIRVAVETIPPFLMAGTRFLLAGTLAMIVLRSRGVELPNRVQIRAAAVIGALLLVGGNGLVTWSELEVPSGAAALVVATEPLWVAVLDWLAFGGPRPGLRQAAGLLLGFAGVGLLIGPELLSGTSGVSALSWLAIFLAPLLWAFGSLRSRRAALPVNPFMSTTVQMLSGGALLLLAGLATGEVERLNLAAISGRSLSAMLYLAVFGSIVTLSAYVWLLRNVQASRVATYAYVNPVIAVLLGWLVLAETVTIRTGAAMAIIVLAVVLITAGRRASKAIDTRAADRTAVPAREGTKGSGYVSEYPGQIGRPTAECEQLAV